MRYVPPNRRLTFNGLHGVISQKIVLFITTAVRTSDPTKFTSFAFSYSIPTYTTILRALKNNQAEDCVLFYFIPKSLCSSQAWEHVSGFPYAHFVGHNWVNEILLQRCSAVRSRVKVHGQHVCTYIHWTCCFIYFGIKCKSIPVTDRGSP
jgi:hypothetical protein